MQKVVGSSPIIRFSEAPLGGILCCLFLERRHVQIVASAGHDDDHSLLALAPPCRAGRLSHNPHLVPADLAVANRQFDAPVAFVGDFACLFPSVDLVHVTGDAAIIKVDPFACLELEVEVLRRRNPRSAPPGSRRSREGFAWG